MWKTLNWWLCTSSEGETFLSAAHSHPLLPRKFKWIPFQRSWKANTECPLCPIGDKKAAVKCRPLPQVLQRSRETGLKINRPPSTWSWGMKERTCLLAPDADLIKKKPPKQTNKQTTSHKCQTGATCRNQDHVRLLDERPTGWRLKRKKSWAGRKKTSASVTQKIPLKFLSILLVCLFAVGSRLCPQRWEEKLGSHREVSIQY